MVIINPREVAAQTLMEICTRDAYNNRALQRALKNNGALLRKDKALVTEIVNGTLRQLLYIDYVLEQLSNMKCSKMKPWILTVLRTAAYQILFMEKIPQSAACNEAVKLVRARGYGSLSSFVNGVLRAVCTKGRDIALPAKEVEPARYLELKYSHPLWIIKMWLSQYEFDFVEALCKSNNSVPDVTLVANSLRICAKELQEVLLAQGVLCQSGSFFEEAVHVKKTSDMTAWDSFRQGLFHVQDESSMAAVYALAPKGGEKILDMCAAPGGKSLLMAELMGNQGCIVARDVFTHKLELLEETAKRLGITILQTEEKDGAVFDEESVGAFDKVLVDAPCSGLGLLSKKPDMRMKKDGNAIDTLVPLQRSILENAARYVKKGGTLVYSTCTICKKENQKNIEWFLQHHDFSLCPLHAGQLPDALLQSAKKEGYIEMFPHIHGTDGFFIARMKREEL